MPSRRPSPSATARRRSSCPSESGSPSARGASAGGDPTTTPPSPAGPHTWPRAPRGGATNLAARLQAQAGPGEILLSADAYRRVADWLGDHGLKATQEELE